MGAPQRPRDQQRLEEQADHPRPVGVEPEGICVGDQLIDVARKDCDEEGRHDPADQASVPHHEQQGEAQPDLDEA